MYSCSASRQSKVAYTQLACKQTRDLEQQQKQRIPETRGGKEANEQISTLNVWFIYIYIYIYMCVYVEQIMLKQRNTST